MSKFVDRVVVHATAGAGGNGGASVHREKFKPLGGPDGGNGGRGGSVVLVVDPGVHTLLDFHHRPHAMARNGKQGQGSFKAGANAEDLELRVPDGTVVFDTNGEIIADLVGAGTRFVAAAGGRGGLGNAALASSARKAPGFALLGEPGETRDLVLVHVVDCATYEPGRDPVSDVEALEDELARYTPALGGELADRPRLIALNKIDVPDAAEMADLVTADLVERYGWPVFPISTASRAGLRELAFAMAEQVHAHRAAQPVAEPTRIVLRPQAVDDAGFTVEADPELPGGFVVRGARPERWIRQTAFDNDEAVGYLADRLARLGVEDALAEAGAQPGCPVTIGDVTFDWEPSTPSGVAVMMSGRGTDRRLEQSSRVTAAQRKMARADPRKHPTDEELWAAQDDEDT